MATRMFLKGRNISVASIQGMTRDAAGVLTVAGSSGSLTGKLGGISFSGDLLGAQINSIDDLFVNNEAMMDNIETVIEEIMTLSTDSAGGVAIITLANLYDYAKVILTAGGNTYAYIGLRGALSFGVNSAGENVARLGLRSINQANVGPLVIS